MLTDTSRLLLITISSLLYLNDIRKETFENEEPPLLFVLTRTSGRPMFFKKARDSLKEQTYGNWQHLVSADTDESYEYAIKDPYRKEVVRVQKTEKTTEKTCPYNLYFNKLIEKIPDGSWMCFLDDDGKMYDRYALENLSKQIKLAETNNKGLIITLGDGKVSKKPKCWGMSGEKILERKNMGGNDNWHFAKIDTSHICIKKTQNLQPWIYKCAGDANFFYDNLAAGYEPFYAEEHIISGNYMGYGSGKQKDLIPNLF